MRCDEEDATDEANNADDGYEHNENNNDDTNDEDDSITLPDIGPEHHLINTPPETQCHPGASAGKRYNFPTSATFST